jgi:hypothetical protein
LLSQLHTRATCLYQHSSKPTRALSVPHEPATPEMTVRPFSIPTGNAYPQTATFHPLPYNRYELPHRNSIRSNPACCNRSMTQDREVTRQFASMVTITCCGYQRRWFLPGLAALGSQRTWRPLCLSQEACSRSALEWMQKADPALRASRISRKVGVDGIVSEI